MNKLRFLLALWTAKASRLAMRLLGRNASYLPGRIALKICPRFLAGLTMPKTVIAITGTNGKTTVSNMVHSILVKNGCRVTNNGLGSNVLAGIAATLLEDADLLGKPKKDIAVLEVDERSSLLVYPHIQPDYLLCNNIMRDSIRRNAHTGFIHYIISTALPEKTKLILNGDDLICATLAPQCQNRTYFGMDALVPEKSETPFVSDIVYCPQCGARLESQYLRYNHIGRLHCPQCNVGHYERTFRVTEVDGENRCFTMDCQGSKETYPLLNGNIVNIYNTCGAIALLRQLGLTQEQIRKGLEGGQIVRSRYDRMEAGSHTITMQMAKGLNPIACTQAFRYVAGCPGENKALVILIDDKRENMGDSENVCWQYDCDYSFLADPSIGQIIFSGARSKDHYLRSLLAGVPQEKIRLTDAIRGGSEIVDMAASQDLYVLYDNYSLDDAEAIRDTLAKRAKEGK